MDFKVGQQVHINQQPGCIVRITSGVLCIGVLLDSADEVQYYTKDGRTSPNGKRVVFGVGEYNESLYNFTKVIYS